MVVTWKEGPCARLLYVCLWESVTEAGPQESQLTAGSP